MKQEARADQLRAAIVEKEQRQIRRYFGSKEGFSQTIHEFLMNYLGNENPNNQSNEGGSSMNEHDEAEWTKNEEQTEDHEETTLHWKNKQVIL